MSIMNQETRLKLKKQQQFDKKLLVILGIYGTLYVSLFVYIFAIKVFY